MRKALGWFLVDASSVSIMLGGLLWDVQVHAASTLHSDEVLLDLSNPLGNPPHVLIALGLVLTVLVTLGGFTASWLEERGWKLRWQSVAVPLALWAAMGVAGLAMVVMLGNAR